MALKGLTTEARNPWLLYFQVWLSSEVSTGHGSPCSTQREQRATVPLADKGTEVPEVGRQGWEDIEQSWQIPVAHGSPLISKTAVISISYPTW